LAHALPEDFGSDSFSLFDHIKSRFEDDAAFSADEFAAATVELHRVISGVEQPILS
jgi:hypothetical protein